jgi:hypothetical protein
VLTGSPGRQVPLVSSQYGCALSGYRPMPGVVNAPTALGWDGSELVDPVREGPSTGGFSAAATERACSPEHGPVRRRW